MFVIFIACSIINAGVCGKEVLQISEEPITNVQQCMMYSQPQMARWSLYHPNKRIERFKCVDDKRLRAEEQKSI